MRKYKKIFKKFIKKLLEKLKDGESIKNSAVS
jgi:hypothetical protein